MCLSVQPNDTTSDIVENLNATGLMRRLRNRLFLGSMLVSHTLRGFFTPELAKPLMGFADF